MSAIALIKDVIHTSIAEGIYEEIVSRSSRYYHFVGAVLDWPDEAEPPYPRNTIAYEREVRRNIVFVKEIKPNDVCFVTNKIDWAANTVYDAYDDNYSSGIIGIDLVDGGADYTSPTFTFTSTSGTGATANATVVDGSITAIRLTYPGSGYNTAPTITITDSTGSGASANAIINLSSSGQTNLEDCSFYVLTSDFNVYKCIDNNNGSNSTVKPTSTSASPFTLSDGYTWKFMYNIPISLRNKFMTTAYMPVVNSVLVPFYSDGEIKSLTIVSPGNNYTSGSITVVGDGYIESDPLYVSEILILDGGSGWAANTTANIAPPITGTTEWSATSNVVVGDKIYYNYNIYDVVKSGTLGDFGPTHTGSIALNGTAGLKFIAQQARGNVVIASNSISSVSLVGSVKRITLNTGGSGYSTPPAVTLVGGGGANAKAYATVSANTVNQIIVSEIGEGYTSPPSVVIGTEWVANANVNLYDQFFYGSRLYTVTGYTPDSNITGNYLSVINLTTTGVGYSTAAKNNTTVTLSTSGAFQPVSNATAVPIFTGTYLTGFTILNNGYGYNSNVENNTTVTISTTGAAQPTTNATGNLSFTEVETAITEGFRLGATAPVHTSGTVVNGTANLLYSGVVANATCTLKYGAGYSGTPTVVFEGTGSNANSRCSMSKSEAIIEPIFSNNQLVDYKIIDGGVGYTYATLSVSGDGSCAAIVANFSQGDLNSLNSTTELLSEEGYIDRIQILSGGYGYSSATANIKGSGSDATISANIISGRLSNITLTDPGSGYTYADIQITGDGTGATARAILPPPGGHGKNPVKELFAKTLMFATNITDELNKGFNVNNDYRQFGIIKDVRNYTQDRFFNQITGSACWVASGNVDTSLYYDDLTVTRALDDAEFIVVSSDNGGLLLQSINDQELLPGQGLREPNGNLFIINEIGYPDIDKYSGSLLFIDNRKAFLPEDSQIVTLRTILKF